MERLEVYADRDAIALRGCLPRGVISTEQSINTTRPPSMKQTNSVELEAIETQRRIVRTRSICLRRIRTCSTCGLRARVAHSHVSSHKREAACHDLGASNVTPAKIHCSHSLPSTRMITIYHNPRCSKSRGACELINDVYNPSNEPVEVVEYLRTPLSVAQLKELNRLLGCPVRDMVRESESVYGELGLADASVSDDQLYEAMAAHPILLQRPIVVRNGHAVIGRPPELVKALFSDPAE